MKVKVKVTKCRISKYRKTLFSHFFWHNIKMGKWKKGRKQLVYALKQHINYWKQLSHGLKYCNVKVKVKVIKCRNSKCRKTVIFTCFGILKTFRWEYETNKKATSVHIKNNTSVNKSNTIMDEYIYIWRSRSFNVKRGTCVKRLFWPPTPRRPKNKKNVFQHFLLISLLEH